MGAQSDRGRRRVLGAGGLVVPVVLVVVAALAGPPGEAHAQTSTTSTSSTSSAVSTEPTVATAPSASRQEQELLDRFAPVLAIRKQPKECHGDERYRPMVVDAVLGRDDVVLRDANDDIVTRAPTAADLAGLGPDYWLDFPHNALKPGCRYEKWFRSFDVTPSIYGRVTKDQGQLVVQYWFFWVFNQWNDLHESDWEGIQLEFDTDDLDVAMRRGPIRYAYAQHEGAEYADAGDDKVEIVDGTHPVAYAAGGSHATYFWRTRWFGKSATTGFGCDDTTGPTDRLTPRVIALPEDAPADGEFSWLSYAGHWGEREPFFNDGPTGPITKVRWDDPLEWVDDQGRQGSIALPFAKSSATETFCALSASGSRLFNRLLDDPLRAVASALAVLAALVMVVRFGARGLLGRAMRTAWRSRRPLLRVNAVMFVGGMLAWFMQYVVLEITVLGRVVDLVEDGSAWALPLVALASALVMVPVSAWVIAATMLVESGEVRARRALAVDGHLHSPVLRSAMALVATVGLTLLVFPLFVLLVSIWIVAPVASGREGLAVRASLGRSQDLLRGRRWRSLALAITLCLVLSIGGLVGALTLLVTSATFALAAIVASLVNAFLIPYVALVAVHYYEDVTQPAQPSAEAPSALVG